MSPEEVARFLEAAPGPKWKAALSAAYAAGLRVSEVVALKVNDVDSERMLLRIEQGTCREALVYTVSLAIFDQRLNANTHRPIRFTTKSLRRVPKVELFDVAIADPRSAERAVSERISAIHEWIEAVEPLSQSVTDGLGLKPGEVRKRS